MTLRDLLNKNLEPERVVLNYDGCETQFESIDDLEVEAFEADLVDEDIISYQYGRKNNIKTLIIKM